MNNREDIKHLQTYEGKIIKSIELCEQGDHTPNIYEYYNTGIKITFTDNTFIHLFDGEQYQMGIVTNEKDITIDTGGDWDEFED